MENSREQIVRQIMETGSMINKALIESRDHLHSCLEKFQIVPNSEERSDLDDAIDRYRQCWGMFEDSVGDYIGALQRAEEARGNPI